MKGMGSPLTSPYRTSSRDYGKGMDDTNIYESNYVSQHRKPRSSSSHRNNEDIDNVASLMQHPRTPSPRKSKNGSLSKDKDLPNKAISIAKHALDIVQSSETVGYGPDVSKHALEHSLGVVKEVAHILTTKLDTLSPRKDENIYNRKQMSDKKKSQKSYSPSSVSSSVPSPPKGPVVDKLRAIFGSQLALAQSELKEEKNASE